MQGDCLEVMKQIPDGSIDMILTDPPYGTMKGANLDGWFNGKTDWDENIDTKKMFEQCNRILRTNGGLLLFSQEPYTSNLITSAHGNLPFSYRMSWLKDHFANSLIAKKAPVNYTEDICVFFKKHSKHDFYGNHPLRDYARKIIKFTGKTTKQINADLGHRKFEHFTYVDSTQFSLCTEKTYNEVINFYNIDAQEWFVDFSKLDEINKNYRKNLIQKMTTESPKIFNLPEGKKYKSNVLEYKKDYSGHHPTQKPVALLEDLIRTYTDEGQTVLDFTMGSGSTGVAAKNLNRDFIGIELDEEYFKIAEQRING